MTVEQVAINLAEARITDNDGEQQLDTPLREDGDTAYFAPLPVTPIPQRTTASATPAMFPVPIVPASAVDMAWKGVTSPPPPSPGESSRPTVPRMASPKCLICTQPRRHDR